MTNENGFYRATYTNRLFRGAPRRPNAVFSVPGLDKTYFVRGELFLLKQV